MFNFMKLRVSEVTWKAMKEQYKKFGLADKVCSYFECDEDTMYSQFRKVFTEDRVTNQEAWQTMKFVAEAIDKNQAAESLRTTIYDCLVLSGIWFTNVPPDVRAR